jgi:hypothetical protein
MRKFVLAAVAVLSAAPAHAMCVDNRSERNVAVVRSAPFSEMTDFYQTMVGPQSYACEPMHLRADGKTPLSVYVIDDRGKCKVATGCFYENRDDANVFVGAGTWGCPISFNVSNCASR